MSNKVKISYQDDIRLKSIENINSLDALIEDAASTFDLEKGSFIVKYKDNIIADNQHFLQLKSNNQGTLRLFVVPMPKVEQIQLPKIEQPQIEQPKVEQPKIEQPIPTPVPKVEQPKEQPKPIPNYPSKPNIFQALFSNPPQNNSNSGSNSLFSGLLSLIPGMGGLGGLGNMGGDLSSIMTKNLSSIMKIFTENLPKDKMEELLVAVIKTIPREQLVSLLQNALASPKVQELLITSLLNTFDNLEKKQEKSQENTNQAPQPTEPQPTQTQVQEEIQKKQREWEEKTKQEEELKKQENLRKQEEEAQRIREEEKKRKELENQKRLEEELENQKKNAELKKQEEEKIRLLEELRKQQDEENRRKQEEFRRQEELRKQQEEENRKKQEEEFKKQEELKKQQEEELRRQQEEELKKQEEIKKQEELLRQQEEKENQRIRFLQPYFQRLQNSNVPYESFRAAEEMGFINLEDVNGIEKVVTLLIKYKGNVELVANELFN